MLNNFQKFKIKENQKEQENYNFKIQNNTMERVLQIIHSLLLMFILP